ncbi:MAG TPA: vanadium-dependent haloperoxidase [Candidatus Polarisedimenticolaceae bacterium]|nr:vanadium-dependent haloperoxidase [Candidatus Polarisedimenticolaceae bacterium]
MKTATLLGNLVLAAGIAALPVQAFGVHRAPTTGKAVATRSAAHAQSDVVHRWNRIAIDATGLDHAPGHFEHPGPGRASRAMAIVHIAMFEAVNAIQGGYQSYAGVAAQHPPASLDAAVAQAAHDTLAALFTGQVQTFDDALAEELGRVHSRRQRERGIELGQRAAAAVLAMRVGDGSEIAEAHVDTPEHPTSDLAGHWRQDPISQHPLALGAHWGSCTPFVLQSGSQFRVPPPPAMTSPEYAAAFDEVKRLGGDDVTTPTERTDEQTVIGIYWAYDGMPSLCAPPRLYNQITVKIADERGLKTAEVARLLALVNVAMADAGIAIWESKYYYDFWRPITGIREADPGTGPTGSGDGNDDTLGDVAFTPLGAPASNTNGSPNFTPPFPAYPSGHAGFGGALFQTLRRFFGTDEIAFTFVSDELNGVTVDNAGNERPLVPRTFSSLSQAEDENGQSRIYLGIHWHFDKVEGIAQGRQVADYVFDHAFQPAR